MKRSRSILCLWARPSARPAALVAARWPTSPLSDATPCRLQGATPAPPRGFRGQARRQGRANFFLAMTQTPKPSLRSVLATAVVAVAAAAATLGSLAIASESPPGDATARAAACPGADAPAADTTGRKLRKSVRCLLNTERAVHGFGKLKRRGALEEAAQRHTKTMVETDCLAHRCGGEVDLRSSPSHDLPPRQGRDRRAARARAGRARAVCGVRRDPARAARRPSGGSSRVRSRSSTPRRRRPSTRASAAATSCTASRTPGSRSASAARCARRPARPTASAWSRRRTRPSTASPPGERYAEVYEINMTRCIFCGYCEVACPFDAITLGHDYELSDYDRSDLIFTKEMLLAEPVERTPLRQRGRVDTGDGGSRLLVRRRARPLRARRGRAAAQPLLQRARRWSCT